MGEHEKSPSVEDGPTETLGTDPGSAAVAVALARKRSGANQDERLDAFLDEHTRMLRLQMEHLHEERALHHRRLGLNYFGDRLRIGLHLLGIAFGLIVVVGLCAMVWQAREDHGLVVEAFSVPPDVSQRGLTGHVVAAQVLDKLAALQAATASERPAQTYENNWGEDLKVEIPETGVSIGELSRYLRQWLGHQTRISGEVFRTPTGLTITARTGANVGDSFSGGEADLNRLLQQSAEAIYRRTQPYRFAFYLYQHGRSDEGLADFIALADGPAGADRLYADHVLSTDLMDRGDVPGAIARAEDAVKTAPDSGIAWDGMGETQRSLGHDQAALASFERAIPLTRHSSDAELGSWLAWQLGYVAEYHGDFQASARFYQRVSPILMISRLGLDHDASATDAASARAHAASAKADDPARSNLLDQQLIADIALGRWPQAISAGQAVEAFLVTSPVPLYSQKERLKRALAYFAYAKAMTGDMAGAQAMVATTPLDCYNCVRMRGRIALAGRDFPGAERWFAEAVRQAPSIPMAYSDWGDALLAKGDVAGAIAKFRIAHQNGPHFADPLKGWGNSLARQGKLSDAVTKYDEALKYAPAWPELQNAREQSGDQSGDSLPIAFRARHRTIAPRS